MKMIEDHPFIPRIDAAEAASRAKIGRCCLITHHAM
jgi:hypothetical protein